MSTTPRTDALKGTPMTRYDSDEFARTLERELAEAKALVAERESRLANIKFLLEPIYGSTNYAPIGGTLDRILNICDRFEDAALSTDEREVLRQYRDAKTDPDLAQPFITSIAREIEFKDSPNLLRIELFKRIDPETVAAPKFEPGCCPRDGEPCEQAGDGTHCCDERPTTDPRLIGE